MQMAEVNEFNINNQLNAFRKELTNLIGKVEVD